MSFVHFHKPNSCSIKPIFASSNSFCNSTKYSNCFFCDKAKNAGSAPPVLSLSFTILNAIPNFESSMMDKMRSILSSASFCRLSIFFICDRSRALGPKSGSSLLTARFFSRSLNPTLFLVVVLLLGGRSGGNDEDSFPNSFLPPPSSFPFPGEEDDDVVPRLKLSTFFTNLSSPFFSSPCWSSSFDDSFGGDSLSMAACRSSCDLNLRSGYKSSSSKSSSSEKEDGRFARHFSPSLGEDDDVDGNLLKAVVFVALFLLLLLLVSPPLQPLLLVKSNENDKASFFVFSLFFPL